MKNAFQRVYENVKNAIEDLLFDADLNLLLDQHVDLVGDFIILAGQKRELEGRLEEAETRASRNGAVAFLAFGLIAIAAGGVALLFLPV